MKSLVFILAAAAMSIVACSVGEMTHEKLVTPLRAQSETKTCDSPIIKVDTSSLKACGEGKGKGHCYEENKVQMSGFPKCENAEVCVPDKVLEAGGEKLKECKFFIGDKPGACVSMLMEDVDKHQNELQKDVCDDDERCVPCIDPTNDEDTHVCDPVGAHEQACVGGVGEQQPSCCHGAGVCLKAEGIPEDSRGDLSRQTCPKDLLCSPAAMVDGNPVKCSALGFSGVCLDVCFASMLKGATKVVRGGCGPTEVCLPCLIGKGQGMPGCD